MKHNNEETNLFSNLHGMANENKVPREENWPLGRMLEHKHSLDRRNSIDYGFL